MTIVCASYIHIVAEFPGVRGSPSAGAESAAGGEAWCGAAAGGGVPGHGRQGGHGGQHGGQPGAEGAGVQAVDTFPVQPSRL